jgi:hypothetical protein
MRETRPEMVSSGSAVRHAGTRRMQRESRFAVYGFQTRFSKVKVNQRESLGLWRAAVRSEQNLVILCFQVSDHMKRFREIFASSARFQRNRAILSPSARSSNVLRYCRSPSIFFSAGLVTCHSLFVHWALLVLLARRIHSIRLQSWFD